jgi:hypothetical protein
VKRSETSVQFGTWLKDVRAQERDRGVDHYELACNASLLTPYIKDNLSLALRDLELLYTKLPTGLMSDDEQRAHWEESRDTYVVQVRDALERIAATLTAVGCTEKELASISDDRESPDDVPQEPARDEEGDGEGDDEEAETVLLAVRELREKAADGEGEVVKEECASTLT